ncbi:MAG: hypothetical protein LBF51_08570 [Zoogloeaceae bacterium]|jgi:hypothetical protein|nr:hypothetical protein [Zoogloeaceae bacterium]
MVYINAYATTAWGATSSLAGISVDTPKGSDKISADASDAPLISTLARQLNEAAERAVARDAGKTRVQLAALEKSLRNEVVGDDCYWFSGYRASAEAENPKSDDPELLSRAEQATQFVSGKSGKNPFAGLSREQLALIMYDQGDAFTLNERRAAFYEHYQQRQAWKQIVCAQAQQEQQATNTFTHFYKTCIAEYQAASPIEQATYPPNYVSRMEYYIGLWESGMGIDYHAGDDQTLLEMLLPEREYDRSLSWGLSSTLAASEIDRGTR